MPAHEIEVSRADVERFMSTFLVRVVDEGSSTSHVVTMSRADWERIGRGYGSPEALVEASFEFLLERESKEQILGSFDVGQISEYFPDFEFAISRSR
jgi:hypothetical protein